MKKKLSIFMIMSIVFIIINIFCVNKSMAASHTLVDSGMGGGSYSTINPDDYKPTDPTIEEAEEVMNKVGVILGAIRNISVIVSVVILMIIGVKYMLGSVEEKANYKATMIPYLIGCILAVSGTTIVSFIYDYVR